MDTASDPSEFRTATGLIALQSLPKVGPVTALRAALHSSFKAQLLDRYASRIAGALTIADERLAVYADAGVDALSFFDERYPDRLRQLPDPPPILYVRGQASQLSRSRLVAVVGTREPTVFGTSAAEELTRELAGAGWGIVSGLAKGIDTIAHRTAVEHDAPTIAVMGGGLDRIYPAENKRLAAQIIDHGGALVAEQPFGAQPRPSNLIARDRLQSGLAAAIVVTQCGVRSGTMHTARYAASQGRAIFCPLPHGDNGASEGLRVLLERPGRELCSLLPAWEGARALCARLGERPIARPVRRDSLGHFLSELDLARRWPDVQQDQQTLMTPALGY